MSGFFARSSGVAVTQKQKPGLTACHLPRGIKVFLRCIRFFLFLFYIIFYYTHACTHTRTDTHTHAHKISHCSITNHHTTSGEAALFSHDADQTLLDSGTTVLCFIMVSIEHFSSRSPVGRLLLYGPHAALNADFFSRCIAQEKAQIRGGFFPPSCCIVFVFISIVNIHEII